MKTSPILCTLALMLLGTGAGQAQYAVTLAAGRPGLAGSVDGDLNAARLNQPRAVAVHAASGQVYVLENSNAVRRFTPGVGVTTFAGHASQAGTTDDTGTLARFNRPEGIAVDDGGTVFVADTLNHTIRRITSAGVVTTIAGRPGIAGSFDGAGSEAEFNLPRGLAIGPGGTLFVADSGNHTIRRITFNGAQVQVTTLAGQPGLPGSKNGTGAGTSAAPQFRQPQGVAVDASGQVFVADTGNNAIRRITPAGVTTVFAGSVTTSGATDGKGGKARFSQPHGIAIDTSGLLHVADTGNAALRRVSPAAQVTTPAGLPGTAGAANGVGAAARFAGLRGVAGDGAGNLFIADSGNHTLRRAYVPGRLPSITAQPKGVTLPAGGKAVFAVKAAGPAPLLYQWQKNGENLPDANEPTLTLDSVTEADQGAYRVVVENPWGLVTSETAPLVVTGQVTWLWAARLGGADEDSALDLLVLPPAGKNPETLLVAGRNKGHALGWHDTAKGRRRAGAVLDKNGDGLNALAADAEGNLFAGGDSVLVNNGKPGLLMKRSPSGATLWTRLLATERGGNFSPNSSADVHGLATDSNGAALVTGYFQGFGKFGTVPLGRDASTVNHAFLAKYTANGDLLWAREVSSMHDPANGKVEGESLGWCVAVDAADRVYVAGMAGPNIRFQRSGGAEDFEGFENTRTGTPFLARYLPDGTLDWAHLADYGGHYFSLRLDPDGQLWVTGFDGDRMDAAQQTAVLEKRAPADGSLLAELRLPGGKGASVDVSATQGVAWLVLDPAGLLDYGGRQFGVPGYRCISLEPDTLAARWDLPVLGALSLAPLALSEQADLRFGAGGLLYAALSFEMPHDPKAQVEFAGRITFPLKNRRSDGFIAAIGERPRIAVQPAHTLAALGEPAGLEVVAEGFLQPSYQWLRNGKPVRGQTGATLDLPAVKLSDAGAWSVRLSNGIDSVTSQVAQLGVVDVAGPGVVPGAAGRAVKLHADTSGNGLSHLWEKVGGSLPAGRASGAASKTLTIRGLLRPDDDGEYVCTVSGPGGNVVQTAPRVLSVKIAPELEPLTLADGIVSQMRTITPAAAHDPARFVITGLPPGLTYDPLTGVITGRATRPGTYTLRITATNVAGSSTRTVKLVIAPLPAGVVGRFAAAVTPDAAVNQALGGRVELTTTPTGALSGKTHLPDGERSFSSVLDPEPDGSARLLVMQDGRTLDLVLDPATQTCVGTLSAVAPAVEVAAVSGYRSPWSNASPASAYSGRWNTALEIPPASVGDPAIPQGNGFVSWTVSKTGVVAVSGRLADQTAITVSGLLSGDGQVLLQQFQDEGRGSLQGTLQHAATSVQGQLRWLKGALPPGARLYAAGFGPLSLQALGGRYSAPASKRIVLGLSNQPGNAHLLLSEGGLAEELAPGFRITTAHKVTVPSPNPLQLTLTITPSTGRFAGRFTLSEPDPGQPEVTLTRQGEIEGLVLPAEAGNIGAGFFLLPIASEPPDSWPILSGQAILEAAP